MRNLSKYELSDIDQADKYKNMNSKYIAAPKNNDTIAVVIKAIEDGMVYFIDEQVLYKSKVLYDGDKQFFRFLNKRFYFEDFMKIYI